MNEQIGNKINDKTYIKLTPFKGFVLENFPFIEADFDAITNYQLLCKVIEYLNNVIANQNTVQELGTDLVNAYNSLVDAVNLAIGEFEDSITTDFNTLHDYVYNYFDNLDVQEEINNKLDAMVEAGTLQEIITDYLNTKAVFCYDNVASMKQATNLINGSYTKTLGYYTKNDGGMATYKIRTKTNDDIVDEMKIIAMNDNTLIAELIYNETINVKQLGVYGDGLHDDTLKIQAAIDKFPHSTLYFPESTYIVSSPILTSANHTKTVQLDLERFSIIKASSNFTGDFVLKLGGKDTEEQSLYATNVLSGITGGRIDCNGICGGIYVYGIGTSILNCEIRNSHTQGIYVPYGMISGSTDCNITNVKIYGDSSLTSIGLECAGFDGTFTDIRTYLCQIGFKIMKGGNYFSNIHCLYSSEDLTHYNDSIGFYINDWNNSLYECYSDQYSTGFYIDGNYRNYFYSPKVFYWRGDEYNHTAFDCKGVFNSNIDNLWVEFHSNEGTNTILKVGTKTNPEGKITNLHISNKNYLTNPSDEECWNPRYNYDLLKLNTNDITNDISGTIISNNVCASYGITNFQIRIGGLTITALTATKLITLPVGYRPKSTINALVFDVHNNQYRNITAWINANGELYINPKENITSDFELIFMVNYPVN